MTSNFSSSMKSVTSGEKSQRPDENEYHSRGLVYDDDKKWAKGRPIENKVEYPKRVQLKLQSTNERRSSDMS